MREVISIHVGQAGVKTGVSCWELFCLEHGIDPDGISFNSDSSVEKFFRCGERKYTPRCVFLDVEPSSLSDIRTGVNKHLFHPESLISGKGDTAHNYARGYNVKSDLLNVSLEKIRRLADDCEGLEGFLIFHAIAGGTGSGFTSLLLEKLGEIYRKKMKFNFCIFPSPQISTSVVESFNSVLSIHKILEHIDTAFMLDNDAMYDISKHTLHIRKPSYRNLNSIVSQLVASVTTSIRFGGKKLSDLQDIQANLVPFPRIHFVTSSLSPIIPPTLETKSEEKDILALTESLFESSNLLAKCDLRNGKYIAICMNFRGENVPTNIDSSVRSMKAKRTVQFIDWSTVVCESNKKSPTVVPGGDIAPHSTSVSMISNTTAIADIFRGISQKYDLLHSKKAFTHWYIREGMEDIEFSEAREDLELLQKDYKDIVGEVQ